MHFQCCYDHGPQHGVHKGGQQRLVVDGLTRRTEACPLEEDDYDDDHKELFYVNHDLNLVYHGGKLYYMTLCDQVIIGSSSKISRASNCRSSSGMTERIISKINFPSSTVQ
jgi:hypothetical protein